jgi:hypothetical protein
MTATPSRGAPMPLDDFQGNKLLLNAEPGFFDIEANNDGVVVGRRNVAIVANAITSLVLYPRALGD